MTVKIYHNPRCTKSRLTLELLREKGIEPLVVEYLKTPPSVKEIASLLKLLGISAKELVRKNEDIYKEKGLSDPDISENDLIKHMHENPILIERPIVVVNNKKAAIGRPPENILAIL